MSEIEVKVFSSMTPAILSPLLRASYAATAPPRDLPKTNILETMEATKKLNLLGRILERVEGSTEPDDVLRQYHTMRKEILEKPEKYAPAMAFEFLQREMMIQIALEEKLNRQLERL